MNTNTEPRTFSYKSLELACEGDRSFIKEMLQTLIESTNEGLSGMKSSIDKENWAELGEFAHKICSPCLHVEATELYAILKQIEKNCRSNTNLQEVSDLILRAEEEIKCMIEWAESTIEKLDGTDEKNKV